MFSLFTWLTHTRSHGSGHDEGQNGLCVCVSCIVTNVPLASLLMEYLIDTDATCTATVCGVSCDLLVVSCELCVAINGPPVALGGPESLVAFVGLLSHVVRCCPCRFGSRCPHAILRILNEPLDKGSCHCRCNFTPPKRGQGRKERTFAK